MFDKEGFYEKAVKMECGRSSSGEWQMIYEGLTLVPSGSRECKLVLLVVWAETFRHLEEKFDYFGEEL